MTISKKIVAKNNKKLLSKLIPDKSLPVFCNSLINPNDEVFNKPLNHLEL